MIKWKFIFYFEKMLGRSILYFNIKVWGMLSDRISCNNFILGLKGKEIYFYGRGDGIGNG